MSSLPSKALRRRQAVAGVCATLTLLAAACTSNSGATGTTERSYPPVNPSVFGSYVGPTGTEPLFPRSPNEDAHRSSLDAAASTPASSSSTAPAKSHRSSGERPASSAQPTRTTATPPSTSKKASPGTPSTKSTTSSRPSIDGPPASADDVQTTGPGGAPVVLAAPDGPISDSEAKNRREIETAWLNTWHTYEIMHTIPPSEIETAFAKTSYGPALAEYTQTAKEAAEYGIRNTGTARHRLWWEPPVGTGDVALVLDCVDSKDFGWYDEQLNKRGGSTAANRFQEYEISSFRDKGTWKVSKVVVTKNKCEY